MSDFEVYKGNPKQTLKMFRRDYILLAIVVGAAIAFVMYFYSEQQNTDKIQPGVFIKGINVSGLTKEEAIETVNAELKKQMKDHIELTYKNNNYHVEVEQIEARFDIESSVDYAFNIGKTGDFASNMGEY